MAKKKSSTPKSASGEEPVDFEQSLAEVEQIVARLEAGELGLTESLQHYEAGIRHLKRCHALLDAAQQRVSLLSGFDADGNPVTQSVQDVNPEEKAAKIPKRGNSTSTRGDGKIDAVNEARSDRDSVDDARELF